jgi:hypothetical protein
MGIGGLIGSFGMLAGGAGMLLTGLKGLSVVVGLLTSPITLVVAAIAGAIYVFTHWEESVAAVSQAWEWLIEQLGFVATHTHPTKKITRYKQGAYGLVGSAQGRGSGALLPAPGSWRPCRANTRISGPSSPKYTA